MEYFQFEDGFQDINFKKAGGVNRADGKSVGTLF